MNELVGADEIFRSNDFFQYIRRSVLPIRPSQYDLSTICNLFCEGCLFFAGSDYKGHKPIDDEFLIDQFFASEARRGVNYAEVAGAEPSLIESKLVILAQHIPKGVIYTNGTRKITRDINYRLQISLWGLPAESAKLRGANIVNKQIKNYRDDRRAIFVFTITGQNVKSIPELVRFCADEGVRLSFNHFSPTEEYLGKLGLESARRNDYFRFSDSEDNMLLDAEDLRRSRDLITDAIARHPETIIYGNDFNEWVHNERGLYKIDRITGFATNCGARVTAGYRHFHADLSDAGNVKCCTPNVECSSCRLYAQALGSVLQRSTRHSRRGFGFERWMEMWKLWHLLFWDDLPAEFQAPKSVLKGLG